MFVVFAFSAYLLQVIGAFILGIHMWIVSSQRMVIEFINSLSEDYEEAQDVTEPAFLQKYSYVLIFLGLSTFMLSFLGYIGAAKESKPLIKTFAILLVIILILQILIAFIVHGHNEKIHKTLPELLEKSASQYHNSPDLKNNWDKLHRTYECCGKDNFKDFESKTEQKKVMKRLFEILRSVDEETPSIPNSCCKIEDQCSAEHTELNSNFKKGCGFILVHNLNVHRKLILFTGVGISLLEFIVLALAYGFFCRSKDTCLCIPNDLSNNLCPFTSMITKISAPHCTNVKPRVTMAGCGSNDSLPEAKGASCEDCKSVIQTEICPVNTEEKPPCEEQTNTATIVEICDTAMQNSTVHCSTKCVEAKVSVNERCTSAPIDLPTVDTEKACAKEEKPDTVCSTEKKDIPEMKVNACTSAQKDFCEPKIQECPSPTKAVALIERPLVALNAHNSPVPLYRNLIENQLAGRETQLMFQREHMLLEQKLHHRDQMLWEQEQFRRSVLIKRDGQFRYKEQHMLLDQDLHNRSSQMRNDHEEMIWQREMYNQDQLVSKTKQQILLERHIMNEKEDEESKKRMKIFNDSMVHEVT